MSLTTFLGLKKVRERFNEEFPKPSFCMDKKILAGPLTKNYTMIGTAFDYLLRFYIQRLNGSKTIHKKWNAGSVYLRHVHRRAQRFVENEPLYVSKRTDSIIKIFEDAKIAYDQYLIDGKVTNELLKAPYGLAQLDHIFRSGFIDPTLGVIDKKDLQDLRNLISAVNPRMFRAKACVLNPTFGEASVLVGGADADLIINDALIDIKTTMFLELKKNEYHQIIGYYCLYKLNGIDGLKRRHKISTLGIYYSRFGYLMTFPVKTFINNRKFSSFLKWFRKEAVKA